MIDYFLGDALEVLSCLFWNTALQCDAWLLIRVFSGANFLVGGEFECDLAHRRSVAVLCILYKIRCNPLHPLYGALPVPYVVVRVKSGTVITHRYTDAPPCCKALQYNMTIIPFTVSLWNYLFDPLFDGVGLAGFKSRVNAFLLA